MNDRRESWLEGIASRVPNVESKRAGLVATALALDFLVLLWSWTCSHPWIDRINGATAGVIHYTFQIRLIGSFVVIGLCLRWWGDVSLRAVGVRMQGLPLGLLTLLVGWIVLSSIFLCYQLATSATVTVDWASPAQPIIDVATEALGNSLYEEVFYRAYLVPSAFALLRQHMVDRRAALLAVLGSQALFAVAHIPHRVIHDYSALEMSGSVALMWGFGIIQSAIYLRTSNLWVIVAVHVLINEPSLLTAPSA